MCCSHSCLPKMFAPKVLSLETWQFWWNGNNGLGIINGTDNTIGIWYYYILVYWFKMAPVEKYCSAADLKVTENSFKCRNLQSLKGLHPLGHHWPHLRICQWYFQMDGCELQHVIRSLEMLQNKMISWTDLNCNFTLCSFATKQYRIVSFTCSSNQSMSTLFKSVSFGSCIKSWSDIPPSLHLGFRI